MPDNPIASLYPQPQQNGLLSNPLAFIGPALQMREFNANRAVGSAFQGALNPDGSVDQGRLVQGLQNPDAALAAPQAIGTMLQQRGQMIDNSQRAFNLASGQSSGIMSILGPLSQDPTTTLDKVRNLTPNLVRAGYPPDMVSGWLASLSSDPKTLHSQLANLGNISMGPAAASGRQTGMPGPNGEPTQTSLGALNVGAPTIPTALPPGEAERLAANQAEYAADQTKSASTLANVRPLQQALPLISQLSNQNFGPGSPGLATIKGALTTAGIIDPNTSDLQVRQETGKYLLRYAKQAQDAGRSDQALSAAIGSNPNLDLTQPANLALVKNQIGMDRMDAALPIAAGTGKGYKDFKTTYYQNNDPRAFSFDLMTPQERGAVIQSLGAPKPDKNGIPTNKAYLKFSQSYDLAKKAGLLTPSGGQDGQ